MPVALGLGYVGSSTRQQGAEKAHLWRVAGEGTPGELREGVACKARDVHRHGAVAQPRHRPVKGATVYVRGGDDGARESSPTPAIGPCWDAPALTCMFSSALITGIKIRERKDRSPGIARLDLLPLATVHNSSTMSGFVGDEASVCSARYDCI